MRNLDQDVCLMMIDSIIKKNFDAELHKDLICLRNRLEINQQDWAHIPAIRNQLTPITVMIALVERQETIDNEHLTLAKKSVNSLAGRPVYNN